MTTETILQIVEAVAWPTALGIAAVVALWIFRAPITRAIDRVKRISTQGADLGGSVQEQSSLSSTSPTDTDLFRAAFDDALMKLFEDALLQDPLLKPLTDPVQRERGLVRHLALSQIRLYFERTYRVIYGSQISALRYLNSVVGETPKSVLKVFFDAAEQQYPYAYVRLSFDQWLGFLETPALIETVDDGVRITVAGREFLKYLIDNGLSESKAG